MIPYVVKALVTCPLSVAALAALPTLALAATPAATPAPPAVSGPSPAFAASGAFFALSVPDARKSAAWYDEKLGMTVVKPVEPATLLRMIQSYPA